MARGTIIDNICMIKHRWHKAAASHMTDVAIFISCHMGWIGPGILTNCINTIVAGITSFTHNVGAIMVDKCTEETSRIMAHGAIPAGITMSCRIRRSSGTSRNIIQTSIMARNTITGDTRVSKNRGLEYINRVTKVTILVCRQMAYRLNDIRIATGVGRGG